MRRIEAENRAGTTGWIEAESDDPVEAARAGLLSTVQVWRKLPLGLTSAIGPRIVRGIPC